MNSHRPLSNLLLLQRPCGLVVCLCAFVLSQWPAFAQVTPTSSGAAQTSKPIYWQQPLLFIPYQLNKEIPATKNIAEVQLLLSRTGANDWTVLQSAKPNVQGFSYHAPEDGNYWFALKHLDAKGQPLDSTTAVAQLHLVIDTQMPQLALSASIDGTNQIAIRYEATDANLQAQSLIVEARPTGGLWTNVSLTPAEISQSDRIIGTAYWSLAQTTGEIEIRGSIADGTGQRGQATATLPLAGPALTFPDKSPAPQDTLQQPNVAAARSPFASPTRDPFQGVNSQAAARPAQDWPANNRITGNQPPGPPPIPNPYATANDNHNTRRTPAKFAVDAADEPNGSGDNNFAPDLLNGNRQSSDVPVSLPPTEDSSWTSAGRNPNEPLLVNARTFDVEYDLAEVGPWGVAKVELWGTQDGGNTWQSFGTDPDNRSPARVTVPNGGTFGFRILVEGANAPTVSPPQSGDKPELVVSVDLQPPSAEILAVEPGEGNLSDHLQIRWKATDDNLEARPVGLFYSSYSNGPWSTVAAGLENSGSYTWRIERHIPGRFYLRLEARDTAGNVATYQTVEPLSLNRPQPTGTLRNVRPIGDVPRVGN